MRAVIVRKVAYRLPQTNRLVWALIVAERDGLTLLFVRKPDNDHSHAIVIAIQNVAERVFENANASSFPITHGDMMEIGTKLHALGDDLSEDEVHRFFAQEGLE